MTQREMSIEECEAQFVRLSHPERIDLVARSLGVLPHDLKQALGQHRLMLVKCSNKTAAFLLGMEPK